jgi:hypothetical protein
MKGTRYKDTIAAKGSQLYAALEAGDTKLADKLYREAMAEFHRHVPRDFEYYPTRNATDDRIAS